MLQEGRIGADVVARARGLGSPEEKLTNFLARIKKNFLRETSIFLRMISTFRWETNFSGRMTNFFSWFAYFFVRENNFLRRLTNFSLRMISIFARERAIGPFWKEFAGTRPSFPNPFFLKAKGDWTLSFGGN